MCERRGRLASEQAVGRSLRLHLHRGGPQYLSGHTRSDGGQDHEQCERQCSAHAHGLIAGMNTNGATLVGYSWDHCIRNNEGGGVPVATHMFTRFLPATLIVHGLGQSACPVIGVPVTVIVAVPDNCATAGMASSSKTATLNIRAISVYSPQWLDQLRVELMSLPF
jgi:hypothetical protein